jgi:hypothetical protein
VYVSDSRSPSRGPQSGSGSSLPNVDSDGNPGVGVGAFGVARGGGAGGASPERHTAEKDVAARAITHLLRQAVKVDPMDGLLASGLRPLARGPRLTLHLSRASPVLFPVVVRGERDAVVSLGPELGLGSMAGPANPFYDSGVLKYYEKAGGAMPPTPFSERQVLAAAVWYVLRGGETGLYVGVDEEGVK